MKKIASFLVLLITVTNVVAQTKDFLEVPAKISEAKKNGNTKLADSLTNDYIDYYLFKLKFNELFTHENLQFLNDYMRDTESKEFKLFMDNRKSVNAILGMNKAEYVIRSTIAKEYVPKTEYLENVSIDWGSLEKKIKKKFGSIGQEMLNGKQMIYYLTKKDYRNYSKYYVLYFKQALKRPEYFINDLTYHLVLKVDDLNILRFACDTVMKYAMEEWYQTSHNAYDTYACLLYRTGRSDEAILWEERALKYSKGSPNEKSFSMILLRMKKGEKLW